MKFYSIFDKKSGSFATPFQSVNHPVATRMFNVACSEEGSMLNSHPEDFSLNYVGDFCEEKGVFLPIDRPEFIANAPMSHENI